ncbi:MAG: hypothetical protein JW928_07990 [Candidatus Aureabacteria bacterium]|nr:hypothetical protein [Candidatus Auribacterota bacterium]
MDIPLKNFYKDMHLAAVISEAVSHKLNNSLSGILGYIQFVMEKIDTESLQREDIEKLIGFLQLAKDESLVSRSLMQELRWFSKQYLLKEDNNMHSLIPVVKNLISFWEMVSEIDYFKKVKLIWDKKKHETRVDVSRESLFCLFYVLMMSIVKSCGERGPINIHINHGEKDDIFQETLFSFDTPVPLSEQDIKESFVLTTAIVKSLYSKIDIRLQDRKVIIVISMPLRVARI